MCLHGSSSVKPDDLSKLTGDGFIRINIYTTIAVHGGQALTKKILENLGNIYSEKDLNAFIGAGILGNSVLKEDFGETIYPLQPKLANVANPLRRDAWFEAVKNRCLFFYEVFNYRNFAT